MPTGSAPEGAYMVTSGTHVNSGCCFDYGNSETDRRADGAGAMDAIYFGTSCWFGGCSGTGPWVQADLEYGLFSGGSTDLEPQPAGLHQPVRHRDAQEQRHHPDGPQGRQRPVGQPDHALQRLAAQRIQPDEASRARSSSAAAATAATQHQPEPGHLLRGRHRRRLSPPTPPTTRSRPTSPRPDMAGVPAGTF